MGSGSVRDTGKLWTVLLPVTQEQQGGPGVEADHVMDGCSVHVHGQGLDSLHGLTLAAHIRCIQRHVIPKHGHLELDPECPAVSISKIEKLPLLITASNDDLAPW